MSYSYTPPQPQDLVRITPVEDGVPSPIQRFVKVSGLSGGLTVTDGVHTITNAKTIDFLSGATVSNSGSGIASIAITGGGGGGGSYTGGIGIDIVTNAGTGTINNTGTIVQADNSGQGIDLQAANSTTGGVPGASAYNYAGDYIGTGTVGNGGYGGSFSEGGGSVTISDTISGIGQAGQALLNGGSLIVTGFAGASGGLIATYGAQLRGGTLTAGNVLIAGGSGSGPGGNLSIGPGAGATNGILLVNNIPTSDPHVLNAKWQSSVAGVGYVGVYSQG